MSSENRELSQYMDKRNSLIKVNHFYQNSVVQPLLTDLYQITMAYAYWKSGKTDDRTVFDLFFRNNPFQGEFTIFAGLEECLKFIENFHYSDGDIEYLKQTLPEGIEDEFFEYLRQLTARDAVLYALEEGSVVFPRVPLIKIEGPLIIVQLLETTLLTLVNFASLMATNAARYRMVAGKNIKLLEFGLRRAQGPDGGLSASKYSYIGGFDGTSNVLAGKLFNIPVKGTHAHAYITSFTGTTELKLRTLRHKVTGLTRDILELAKNHLEVLSVLMDVSPQQSSEGELAAMVSFAIAFPDGFMALVDTYDVKRYSAYRPNSLGFDKNNNNNNKIINKKIKKDQKKNYSKLIENTNSKTIKKCKLNKLNNNQQQQNDKCLIDNNNNINNTSKLKTLILDGDKNGYNINNHKIEKLIKCDKLLEKQQQIELVNNFNNKNIELNNNQNDINHNIKTIKSKSSTTTTIINNQNGDDKFTATITSTTEILSQSPPSLPKTTSPNLPKFVGKSFRSGLLNFCAVALALNDQGYRAVGVRIDSGDLAYLSCLSRQTFELVAERFKIPWFSTLTIVASNDINEETILSLNDQGHKIDCFGIGTHLVTCQKQPALGCVYKMVEINGQPRIKLSQDVEKVTMPGNKSAYRLFGADGHALIDLLQKVTEPPPEIGQKVLCRHPFQESKRAYVSPTKVEALYKIYWKEGHISQPLPTLEQIRDRVQSSLHTVRQDHKRNLNPTPYKVAVSDQLYSFIHNLWLQNAPIGELS